MAEEIRKRGRKQRKGCELLCPTYIHHKPPSLIHRSSPPSSPINAPHTPHPLPPLSPLTPSAFPPPTSESKQPLTGEVAHFEDKFRNEVQSQGRHRKEKIRDNTHVSDHMHGHTNHVSAHSWHMNCCMKSIKTNIHGDDLRKRYCENKGMVRRRTTVVEKTCLALSFMAGSCGVNFNTRADWTP